MYGSPIVALVGSKVRLLTVYGDKDPMLGDAAHLHKMFNMHAAVVLSGQGPAAVLSEAAKFNEQVAKFARRCMVVLRKDKNGYVFDGQQ